MNFTTSAGDAYTPGAGAMYFSGAMSLPHVQVQRTCLERARCTSPLVQVPRTRQERARCTSPLALAQRTRQERA